MPYSGNIPLRHLVYRVLDLPPSMQSLVYDFGQLDSDTERSYATKIVENYVRMLKIVILEKQNIHVFIYVCIYAGTKNWGP